MSPVVVGLTSADKVAVLRREIEQVAATSSDLPLDPTFRADRDGIPHVVNGSNMVSALCGVHTRRPVTVSAAQPCPTCIALATERLARS